MEIPIQTNSRERKFWGDGRKEWKRNDSKPTERKPHPEQEKLHHFTNFLQKHIHTHTHTREFLFSTLCTLRWVMVRFATSSSVQRGSVFSYLPDVAFTLCFRGRKVTPIPALPFRKLNYLTLLARHHSSTSPVILSGRYSWATIWPGQQKGMQSGQKLRFACL